MNEAQQGLHLMAKPIGPLCNLDCGYCFYLEKEQFYPPREKFRMDDEVLRAYVQRYIEGQPSPEVEFTWQGGEPTLMGLDFFRRAVALQRQYAGGKVIRNSLQTNGTLLDEEWVAFLAAERFTVGISIDGPREIHEAQRPDKQGRSSFDDAMRGLRLLRDAGVEFNVLVTVTRRSSAHGLEIYRFLRGEGVKFIQFNPVVERAPGATSAPALADGAHRIQLNFARPPALSRNLGSRSAAPVTPDSVEPGGYGDFLIAVFDEWVRNDVGDVHVMNFEWALASWLQLPATVCLFSQRCGKAMIVEHSGDVYSCDHFMYPEYRVGNVQHDTLSAMAASPAQQAFGAAKEDALPGYCRRCPYLFACHGECPKNRFTESPDGEPGMNYLCPSYEKYFGHITQAMNGMAQLVANGMPAATIMEAFKGPLLIRLPGGK
ncbi:anaerobic sulfatase maturase [Pseudoduganella sp. OTU4001]|uniref:anaerobic sulfatase maturase n=1 Tax=Pseudoduganella sp. OTU4001 TaxID=3043854 RepID=UPI00313AB528